MAAVKESSQHLNVSGISGGGNNHLNSGLTMKVSKVYILISVFTLSAFLLIPQVCQWNHAIQLMQPDHAEDQNPSPFPKLVFVKTHKTGSSTLTNILIRYGLARNMSFYLRGNCQSPCGHDWTDVHPPPHCPANAGCCERDILTFHAQYGEWMKGIFPTAKYITLLRDPVTRLASEYYYENMAQHVSKTFKLKGHLPTLEEVCQHQEWQDFIRSELRTMSKQFGPYSLEEKKRLLREQFAVVGITEEFEKTLILLKHELGLDFADIVYKPLKVSGFRYNLSESTVGCLRHIVREDVELYEYAQSLFRKKLSQLGLTGQVIAQELTLLQQEMNALNEICQARNITRVPNRTRKILTKWCKSRFAFDLERIAPRCVESGKNFSWQGVRDQELIPGSYPWCDVLERDIHMTFPFLVWRQETPEGLLPVANLSWIKHNASQYCSVLNQSLAIQKDNYLEMLHSF